MLLKLRRFDISFVCSLKILGIFSSTNFAEKLIVSLTNDIDSYLPLKK